TAFENLLSTAERRILKTGEESTTIRLADFMGIIPSITGKIELVYEGEQEGAGFVAENLVDAAVKTVFPRLFPKINKLERKDAQTPYDDLIAWFFEQDGFELLDEETDAVYQKKLDSVRPLNDLVKEHAAETPKQDQYFLKELVLWGLVAHKKLSKHRFKEGLRFKDLYGSYISGL
ncbi:MAG: magnesium chelatase, partial [Bacteroidota bacterium]